MQEMLLNSGMLYSVWDAAVSSRFELLMFAISVIGYYILHSSRRNVKEIHKKVDVAFEYDEDPETIDTNPSEHLEQVLQYMQRSDGVSFVEKEMRAFLEKFPEFRFGLREVQIILNFSVDSCADTVLPGMVFEHVKSAPEWSILCAFVDYYMRTDQPEEACDLYELHYATFFDFELNERTEWSLILAALQCERQPLAEQLLQTSQSSALHSVSSIQRWWKRKSAEMCEARVARMGSMLNRLSGLFNDRYPFEDHSDDESTCFLGDDSDLDDRSDADSYCGEMH